MTYEYAKQMKAKLEEASRQASLVMQQFPRGAMGLVPDNIRATPEYKAAKLASQTAFLQLQQFNKMFVKTFRKEYMNERKTNQKSIA